MNCTINPDLLTKTWKARWISYEKNTSVMYGVYLFRKSVSFAFLPKKFVVHVSADSRYNLYVNGKPVCNGPARSYPQKWNYETVDIAPFLQCGENCIAAIVWNFGSYNPLSEISVSTGFILQGDGEQESTVNTDESWLAYADEAYEPKPVQLKEYYAAGVGEKFNAKKHPWNWTHIDFDASQWNHAVAGEYARPYQCIGEYGTMPLHVMYPRPIPFMEEREQRFYEVRRSNPVDVPNSWLQGKTPLTIPAHTTQVILLDQHEETTAYPVLHFSHGEGCKITLTYAESLFTKDGSKGNRNEIDCKQMYGVSDEIMCDGGDNRVYRSLFWRTFRYVELTIQTDSEALCISDIHSVFCAYPLSERATFSTNDPSLNDIWNVGWHTQRLCLNETFFDCPYYEQLQYIGDARIQSLVVQAVSGDSVPVKTAISMVRASLQPEGITLSRYPTREPQIISPFSLVWITMVYDYSMLNDDVEFVEQQIPVMQEILAWFLKHRDDTGMIGPVAWWSFVDWVNAPGWNYGNPPEAFTGHSAILNLQLVYTLQKAVAVFKQLGYDDCAEKYTQIADEMKVAVRKNCYDQNAHLFADTSSKETYSQHVNILGLLTDAFPSDIQPSAIVKEIITDKKLAQCTLYFDYYLFEALEISEQQDLFLSTLTPWRKMIEQGLTTFAETPDPTRSDCHGWSASPLYFFLTLVAGIKPNASGFETVRIAPHFGSLNKIDVTYPHRNGLITMHITKDADNVVFGEVELPSNTTGIFIYKGKQAPLSAGRTKIYLL